MYEQEKILNLIDVYESTLDTVKAVIDQDAIAIQSLMTDMNCKFSSAVYELLMHRVSVMREIHLVVAVAMHKTIQDLYKYSSHPS